MAQALAAAGIAALYGALFSAVALYGMISKVAAGGGAMALTAFAIGVSLRHGILVAALAFVGGFASPAIIGSETPNTPVLFGYLLAIAAGTLAVIRHRGWWPLGWGVLAGSALWTVVWIAADVERPALGLCVPRRGRRACSCGRPGGASAKARTRRSTSPRWSGRRWPATGVLLGAVVLRDGGRQDAGWLALAVHGIGLYALGRWTPRFQYVAGLAPALSLATLGLWWFDNGAWRFDDRPLRLAGDLLWRPLRRRRLRADVERRRGRASGRRCPSRPPWRISCSAGGCCAASRAGTPWGLISIGLAAPFLVAAERLVRWRTRMTGATEALGFLAAGVTFFIAAAIPMELSREWITVAYAIELAAVAYIAAVARSRGDAPALLAAARRRHRPLRAQSRGAAIRPRLLGLRDLGRSPRRGDALPRRRPLAARRAGRRRAARLRDGDAGSAHPVPARRHGRARRRLPRALGLCRGVGRLRAGRPVDRAAAA